MFLSQYCVTLKRIPTEVFAPNWFCLYRYSFVLHRSVPKKKDFHHVHMIFSLLSKTRNKESELCQSCWHLCDIIFAASAVAWQALMFVLGEFVKFLMVLVYCIRRWLWLTNRFTMISSFRFSIDFPYTYYIYRVVQATKYACNILRTSTWAMIEYSICQCFRKWQTHFDYSVGMPKLTH